MTGNEDNKVPEQRSASKGLGKLSGITGLFRPESRGALVVGGVVLLLAVVSVVLYVVITDKQTAVAVNAGSIKTQKVEADAKAIVSDAYKEAKRQDNQDRFNTALNQEGGVAMPFTFNSDDDGSGTGNGDQDINSCGCKIDDAQLIAAMKRLGVSGGGSLSGQADHTRISKSDIYLAITGQLMGEDGEPLSYRGNPIFMQTTGQLTDEGGIAVLTRRDQPLYLGKNGELIDQQASRISTLGDLHTASGILILGDGRMAMRVGNMQRIASSDLYMTREGQLVTVDGRPVRHSGANVYKNDESKLVNRNGYDIGWAQQTVYQNRKGQLVNASGEKFQQPGILFSYEGILIDNDGMLTRPLVNLQQLGESDLYKTKEGTLVDGYGLPVTHYGSNVTITAQSVLYTTSGLSVSNQKGSQISVTPSGELRVPVGSGSVRSGVIKQSDGVALDRRGQKITRPGRMEQRGSSDIYTTVDGLLADRDGKPMLFQKKDTFIDFGAFLPDGSQGLQTYQGNIVTDSSGNRVYLTLDGKLVDVRGQPVDEVGILADSNGVIVTNEGKKIVADKGMERVVTKDGVPVTYNGEEVFKGADGRLYDADGNPILTPDGRAVYMDENGNLVDEDGNLVDNMELMAGERPVKNGELTTRRAITAANGEKLLYNGQEVFMDASGRLVDDKGNPILTADGREVFLDENGNLVDKNGNIIDEDLLRTANGRVVKSGIVAGREQVVTKTGAPVTYKGQKVFRGHDGALYDEDGNPILTDDGKRIYIDKDGNLIDEDGNLVEDSGLKVAGERVVGSGDLTTRKVLTDKNGNRLTYNGESVFVGKDGKLYDSNGNPILTKDGREVYMDANGNLVDKDGNLVKEDLLEASNYYKNEGGLVGLKELKDRNGKALTYNGKTVYTDKNGRVVDENGNPILTADGREVFVDANGNLVDANGNRITEDLLSAKSIESFDNNGQLQSLTELRGQNGEQLYVNGKKAFTDSNGRLVDENGRPMLTADGREVFVDENGNLVDKNGNAISEAMLTSVEQRGLKAGEATSMRAVTDKNGNALYFNGKKVYRGKDGRLYDENGNVVKTADGRDVYMDEDGNLVDAQGRIIDEPILKDAKGNVVKDGLKLGKEKLFTKDGGVITYDGKEVFRAADGSLVDAQGNPILTADGKKIYMDANGNLVDADGKRVEDPRFGVKKHTVVNSGIKKGRSIVKTKDGGTLKYDGKDVYRAADGSLVDANGNPILTADGKKIFMDEDGFLIDENGNRVEDPRFSIEKETAVKSGITTGRELVRGKDGSPLKYNGKDVYRAADGSLVDENGNPILTKDGRKVYMDKDGFLVDKDGNRIEEDLLTTSSGEAFKNEGGLQVLKELKDSNGKQLYVNGKKAYRDAQGRLVDEDGNLIKTADGRQVYIDENGNLVDKDGNAITEALLNSIEKRQLKAGEVTGMKAVTDKNGNPMYYNGKKVYRGKDGRLRDENGNLIKTADGRDVYMDENGNLVDEFGNKIEEPLLRDANGKVVKDGFKLGKEKLFTKDGGVVTFDGKEVFRAADGSLVDANGNPILTADGKKIFMDEDGNLVDELGRKVNDPRFAVENRTPVTSGIQEGRSLLKTPDGSQLQYKGKDVYRAADGSLVDENGNPILTADGKKIYMDKQGRLVDEDGNLVEDPNFKKVSKNFVNSGLTAGLEQLTTKDGTPVKYNGKDVYKLADGTLVDADGNPVLTKDGRQVYMNEDGQLVDIDGNIITEDLLTADGEAVHAGDLTTLPAGAMAQVGQSDLYVSRDGLLLDKDGKPITYNGKKVRVGKNGQLFDENGNPVLDKDGNAVYMNSKGQLTDASGNLIDDSLLADGDGVLIGADGKSVKGKLTRIGDSDMYRTADGRLVDADGKPIKFNGESVFVGEDGKLYTADGKPVTDSMGNAVYMDPATGDLVNRNGEKIGESILTNHDGVLIDGDGELVTAGGKLTKIPGTNLYKTADGQVVDANGKPVMMNGQKVYTDSQGRLVNRYGQPLKYKGKRLLLSPDGRLVDRSGQPIVDENGQGIVLSPEGGLVNDEGQAVSDAGEVVADKPQDRIFSKPVGEIDPRRLPPGSGQNAPRQDSPNTGNRGKPPAASLDDIAQAQGKPPAAAEDKKGIVLDGAAAERLQRRYKAIKDAMANDMLEARAAARRQVKGNMIAVGGTGTSGLSEAELAALNDLATGGGGGAGTAAADGEVEQGTVEVFKKGGSFLYGVSSYQFNTDFPSNAVVEIIGLSPRHPLYSAKAIGSFQLAYDHMVLTFNRICPIRGDCVAMNGVALDPSTSAAGMASDVDRHLWYRYGGLFAASLLEGASIAAGETATREETVSPTGTRVTTSGIDGKELTLRSLGKVGERFAEAFAGRIDRPVTVSLNPGSEMSIILFDDIKGVLPE